MKLGSLFFTFGLMGICTASAAVEISKYYNNAQNGCFILTSDDMHK